MGDAQQADTFIKKARAIDKSNVGYIYEEAQIYALLGKTKEGLSALRDSLEKHYAAEAVTADPNVDSLRNSPEFNDLIKKCSAKKTVGEFYSSGSPGKKHARSSILRGDSLGSRRKSRSGARGEYANLIRNRNRRGVRAV